MQVINEQFDNDTEKLRKIRLLMVRTCHELSCPSELFGLYRVGPDNSVGHYNSSQTIFLCV